MSVTGLFGSSGLLSSLFTSGGQSNAQKLKQEFQQLGQDLQSGNLSAAQADFATLQQNSPFGGSATSSTTATQGTTATSGSTGGTVAKEFQQLGTDLQSGNLSAAQGDYSNIQQTLQSAQGSHRGHGHHHHRGGGDDSGDNANETGTTATGNTASPISQALTSLGQALQAGNLSVAQSAYATLQQDFEQFAQGNGIVGVTGTSGTSSSSSTGVSISA